MGRENYYKPGSFYRVCQRTGFAVRAERTRQEWNGLIVRKQSWEIRQPQDFVKGVRDDQTVPRALPRTPPIFLGPAQSTLAVPAPPDSGYVLVNAPFPFNVGDQIALTINSDLGIVFFCYVISLAGDYSTDYSTDFYTTAYLAGNSGQDFDFDFNIDFNAIEPGLIKVFLSEVTPGWASNGNLISNLSYGSLNPANYGASNGG